MKKLLFFIVKIIFFIFFNIEILEGYRLFVYSFCLEVLLLTLKNLKDSRISLVNRCNDALLVDL